MWGKAPGAAQKRDEPDRLRFHTAPHMKKVTAGIGFWHVIGVFWGGNTEGDDGRKGTRSKRTWRGKKKVRQGDKSPLL